MGLLGRGLVGPDREWDPQARKRLGPRVLAEVFEQVGGLVPTPATRGAWLRGWR